VPNADDDGSAGGSGAGSKETRGGRDDAKKARRDCGRRAPARLLARRRRRNRTLRYGIDALSAFDGLHFAASAAAALNRYAAPGDVAFIVLAGGRLRVHGGARGDRSSSRKCSCNDHIALHGSLPSCSHRTARPNLTQERGARYPRAARRSWDNKTDALVAPRPRFHSNGKVTTTAWPVTGFFTADAVVIQLAALNHEKMKEKARVAWRLLAHLPI
jgi:hypothetical protein